MMDLYDELVEVQTRLAYQEDTISQLNQVVTKQDAELIQLQQQVRLLAKRLDDLLFDPQQSGNDTAIDRPPHY